jgi:hypothetical protein
VLDGLRSFVPMDRHTTDLEDGVHDEHVRTTAKLLGDTAMVYTHLSQHSNESAEWNDFSATLVRVGHR